MLEMSRELPEGDENRPVLFFSSTIPEGYGCGVELDVPFIPMPIGYLCVNINISVVKIHLAILLT